MGNDNLVVINRKILYSTILVVLFLFGCVFNSQKSTPSSSGKNLRQIEINVQLADSLWSKRYEPDNALDALFAYECLASQDSTDLAVWSKLVHAHYYYAEYISQQNLTLRDSLFAAGYNVTKEVLRHSIPYQSVLQTSGDPQLALKSLDLSYTSILYWGTACLAQWSATKGEIIQRSQRGWILAALNHINTLDSTFYFGGYERFMGALLCIDPVAGSDALVEAKKYFDRALAIEPDYLGTYILEARYYAPKVRDKVLFDKLTNTVEQAKVDLGKPFGPENYFEQKRCEILIQTANKDGWFTQ